MKKAVKKTIVGILVGLLVLIVIAAVLINVFGDTALKAGVETGATRALQVPVSVNDMSLGIFAGKLNMNDLVVSNPEGYANPTFLELGHGFVHLNTSSLLSDTVEIQTLRLDNVHLTIEQKGLTNNLQEILDNLPKSEETPAPQEPGKDLLVKQLDIEGIKVTVNLLPVPGRADNLTLNLDPIHMENIGTGEEMNTSELVSKIVMAIAGGIAEQGKDILPTEMLQSIGTELTEKGKQLLETGQDIGTEIIEGGRDIGEEATEALKGLNPFQKKE